MESVNDPLALDELKWGNKLFSNTSEETIQINLVISKSKGMKKILELSEAQHKQIVTSPKYNVYVQFRTISF